MKKVKLEICCGTACYILGADKLVKIDERMHSDWRERIEIVPVGCLGVCESENIGSAPFVRINDKIISNATVDEILKLLQGILAGENNNG